VDPVPIGTLMLIMKQARDGTGGFLSFSHQLICFLPAGDDDASSLYKYNIPDSAEFPERGERAISRG